MSNKNKKYLRYFLLGATGILLIILVFIAVLYAIIFKEVRGTCLRAETVHKKDCVNSLILVLEDPERNIKEKNDAIWALGQLADKRALPKLKSLYTGQIPEREPLNKVISQYELRKAIRWIENGNWTSWMYFNYRE